MVGEVPITFVDRIFGESKLCANEVKVVDVTRTPWRDRGLDWG